MYHISTISDILRQGVDSLAQWLEHWISTPAVWVRIPSGTWDFFQAMHHLLVTNFHIRKNRRCRKQHSLAFQIPSASKEAYKSSFFPQTIRDWNDLPDSLVSSAEMSDDYMSKFASFVRSRD